MSSSYSQERLKNLWSDGLEMPDEMSTEVENSGLMEATAPVSVRKKRTVQNGGATEDTDRKISLTREASESRDELLKALNSDASLHKPSSELWQSCCSRPGLTLDSEEARVLAQQCRSAFEYQPDLTCSKPGAKVIATDVIRREFECRCSGCDGSMLLQQRDCILFLSHLYRIGCLSDRVYCCLHRILLHYLSEAETDPERSRELQKTLEMLMEQVTRRRHIVAYFCNRDDRLIALLEASSWSEKFFKDLRSSVRSEEFKSISTKWTKVCQKIRLYPKPEGIENLATQCREFFTGQGLWSDAAVAGDGVAEDGLERKDCLKFIELACRQNPALQELVVELISWMLRSAAVDGDLKQWQQVLQATLDSLLKGCSKSLFENRSLTAEESQALELWEEAVCKDRVFYYESQDMLNGYIKKHMPQKVELFKASFKAIIKKQLDLSMSTQEAAREPFSVLSVGCGPGSELLAVMEIWADQDHGARPLNCVGVDKFWWPKAAFLFKQSLILLNKKEPIRQSRATQPRESQALVKSVFVHSNMQDCHMKPGAFDLVVLSFVGAGGENNGAFFSDLAQLLRTDGVICLIDNYVSPVLSLMDEGFHPIAVWLSTDRQPAEAKPTVQNENFRGEELADGTDSQPGRTDQNMQTGEAPFPAKVCFEYRKQPLRGETRRDETRDQEEMFQAFYSSRGGTVDKKVFSVARSTNFPASIILTAFVKAAQTLYNQKDECDTSQLAQEVADTLKQSTRGEANQTWSCETVQLDDGSQQQLGDSEQFLRFRLDQWPPGSWLLVRQHNDLQPELEVQGIEKD